MTARVDVQGDGHASACAHRGRGEQPGQLEPPGRRCGAGPLATDALPLAALQPLSSLLGLPAASWPARRIDAAGPTRRRWPQLRAVAVRCRPTACVPASLGSPRVWRAGSSGPATTPRWRSRSARGGCSKASNASTTCRRESTARHGRTASPRRPSRSRVRSRMRPGDQQHRHPRHARGARARAPTRGRGRWRADDASLRVVARESKAIRGSTSRLARRAGVRRHGAWCRRSCPGRAQFAGGAALRWSAASWHAQGRRLSCGRARAAGGGSVAGATAARHRLGW
jgi:hypothetical protein